MNIHHFRFGAATTFVLLGLCPVLSAAPVGEHWPSFLRDRTSAVPTSQLGIFVGEGQWLLLPFVEYERFSRYSYQGEELGFSGELDYAGKLTEGQAGLYVAYGLTENLAVELETTLFERATLRRAPSDTTTGMPRRLSESGAGGLELQVRWRFARETERIPGWFAHVEVEMPHQRAKTLIGDPDWETEFGVGAIKTFSWGTVVARASLEYDAEEGAIESGEYAIEYIVRVAESWRVVAALEGNEDELTFINGARWQLSPRALAMLNLGLGLTGEAPDIASEFGMMFRF